MCQMDSPDKNVCYWSSEEGETMVHSGGYVGSYLEEEGLGGWVQSGQIGRKGNTFQEGQ